MEKDNLLDKIAGQFGLSASVKNVYGEPINANGKTIIPVAKIAMGLGAGYGHKNGRKTESSSDEDMGKNEGGSGAGGGMYTTASGIYEVTSKCTRFIPANATRQLVAAAVLAFLLGSWIGRRNLKKKYYPPIKR